MGGARGRAYAIDGEICRGGGGYKVVARMTGVMWWWEWCRGDGDEGGGRMMVV
ncbi:hypothetical protein Tco_1120221, partial [Tanacetum coccineum]